MMDTSLTIEQLERDIWAAPAADVSGLVINVFKARGNRFKIYYTIGNRKQY